MYRVPIHERASATIAARERGEVMEVSRVPDALQRSSRCCAEPGPYEAPAFIAVPVLRSITPQRAACCIAPGTRASPYPGKNGGDSDRPSLPGAPWAGVAIRKS